MSPVEVYTVPAKKLVRKAGSVLAGRSDVMTEDQAMDILSKWRALHAYPINTLQAYLRGVLKRNKFAGAIVAQRLKRTPSIVEKLKRFENMSLDRMQDIGGLRVIVDNIADIYRLHQLMLNSTRFKHQLDLPPHDYIKSPKDDGYRSLHQVIRYQNESHEELNGLRLEIQIRTKLQHSWATAVETLGMIQKSSLKAGQGDDETKEFLKTVSALFALKENQPLPPAFETATRDELIGSLLALDKRKNFLAQLEGVAEVEAGREQRVQLGKEGLQVGGVRSSSGNIERPLTSPLPYTGRGRDLSPSPLILFLPRSHKTPGCAGSAPAHSAQRSASPPAGQYASGRWQGALPR